MLDFSTECSIIILDIMEINNKFVLNNLKAIQSQLFKTKWRRLNAMNGTKIRLEKERCLTC